MINQVLQNTRFAISDICTAFNDQVIGSKVIEKVKFLQLLRKAVDAHDQRNDRYPGQHKIILNSEAYSFVSAGDGPKTNSVTDYVVRIHRGKPSMFLKRNNAGQVTELAVIVYTREAYMKDPEYDPKEDLGNAEHVIVAVLASSAPNSPVSPGRFVANLAGANNEYKCPNPESIANHLEWLERTAKQSVDYWSKWSVVAD